MTNNSLWLVPTQLIVQLFIPLQSRVRAMTFVLNTIMIILCNTISQDNEILFLIRIHLKLLVALKNFTKSEFHIDATPTVNSATKQVTDFIKMRDSSY